MDKGIKAVAKRYRYTGKERDEETGLYYRGARYYPAWLGRWVSCDPASITDELNVYNFVRLNPIRMIDPSGRVPVEPTQRELELLQSIPEEHIAHLNTRDDTKHTKGNDSLPPGFEINPLVLREGPRAERIIVRH